MDDKMVWPIILLVIALVILGILIAMIYFYKGKPMPPTDYYTLFIIGVIWMPFGILQMVIHGPQFSFLFIIGVFLVAVGLKHKNEWKKNHKSWKQLSEKDRQFKLIVILVLGILLLAGMIAFLIAQFLA